MKQARLRVLFFLVGIVLSSALSALTVTIGTGAYTFRYPLSDFCYFSASQTIYLSSEINISNSANLTHLRWNRCDPGANPSAILTTDVWLKETTETTLTGPDWEEPGILVATLSNLDLGPGMSWVDIDINDFFYTPGNNLLVSVRTQYGNPAEPSALYFASGTYPFHMMRAGMSDSSPYSLSLNDLYLRPDIQIEYEPCAGVIPNPAINPIPANAYTNLPLDQILSWSTGGGAPSSYDVYFGTSSQPPFVVNQTATSYSPADLAYGTTYYWKVVPTNATGQAPACPVWSFTTLAEHSITIGDGQLVGVDPFNINCGYARSADLYTSAQIGSNGIIDNLAWYCETTSPIPVPYKIYAKTTTATSLAEVAWEDFVLGATLLKQGTYYFDHPDWHYFTLDNPFYYEGGNLVIMVEVNHSFNGTMYHPQFRYTQMPDNTHLSWRQNQTPANWEITVNGDLSNIIMHIVPLSSTPQFYATPADCDFGKLVTNTELCRMITVSNSGSGVLNINAVTPSGSGFFTLEDTNVYPVSLVSGQHLSVTVRFLPGEEGVFTGSLAVEDDLTRTVHNISLSGSSSDSLNFGGGDATTTAGGYLFANNLSVTDPQSPVYDWITDPGNDLVGSALFGTLDDGIWGPIFIGFDFPYYGNTFDYLTVSTNGFLCLGTDMPYYMSYYNDAIPTPAYPNNLICLFWDDLAINANSHVYFEGSADRLVISYEHLSRHAQDFLDLSAQVILYRDGKIKMQYQNINGNVTTEFTPTIGIENGDGSHGVQYRYNDLGGVLGVGDSLGNIAVLFTPLAPQSAQDPGLAELSARIRVGNATPNPFTLNTSLGFELKVPGTVSVNIYNVRGQLVRKLAETYGKSGSYQLVWDGLNDRKTHVGSGIYFYQLRFQNRTYCGKVLYSR